MRLLLAVLVALVCAIAEGRAESDWASEIERIFGVEESAGATMAPFIKWQGVLARSRAEDEQAALVCAHQSSSPLCATRARRATFIESLRAMSPLQQLAEVQAEANRVPWVEDKRNYGVSDYWATPDEFYARGGDCEDFAFAKYDALKQLGFAEEQLRILVLFDRKSREPHAVLLAMVDGKLWMLDNNQPDIVTASMTGAYEPIYSINRQTWWQHGPALRDVDSAGRRR